MAGQWRMYLIIAAIVLAVLAWFGVDVVRDPLTLAFIAFFASFL